MFACLGWMRRLLVTALAVTAAVTAQDGPLHWSFRPPVGPSVPEVRDAAWPANEIDRFVLARLEAAGLPPNEPAARGPLLRRVTLDLTGLPPTPREVAAFVADESPDAYERVVDRLLASEAYGEHMARFWLDAARYGDTHGLHLDNYREMWPYRDWVVRAFADGMPYDRFLVEQLAGDLLPGATLSQRVASGFNRCHVTTNEGGTIEEEAYVRNVVDRVSTMGTAMLGLTLGCAVCHDHKFDPIRKREFYGLFAFFNNLDGSALDGNSSAPAPVVRVPTPEQQRELAGIAAAERRLDARFVERLASFDYDEPESEGGAAERRTIHWIDDELPPGADGNESGFAWVDDPGFAHRGRRCMRRSTGGLVQHHFRHADTKLRIGVGDVLFAWVRIDPEDVPDEILVQWNDDGGDGWGHGAYWGENAIPYGRDGTHERVRMGDLPVAGRWIRLEVPAATVGLEPGMAVHGMAFTQKGGTTFWDDIGLETRSPQGAEDRVWVDDEAPLGSALHGDGRKWMWSDGDADRVPAPKSGNRLLRRAGKGLVQDFFLGAADPLRVQDGDRLFAWVWLDPDDPPRSVQLQFHVGGSWNHRARWGTPAHGAGQKGGGDFVAGPLPATGRWVRLDVGIAEVGLQPGQKIDGEAFTQVDGTVCWDAAGVRTVGIPDDSHRRSLAAWELMARGDLSLPAPVREALSLAPVERSPAQRRAIRDHWLRHVWIRSREVFADLHDELDALSARRAAIERAIPTTLVMKERDEPRPAFDLVRGQYDLHGDRVERCTPAALPPMAPDLPRNRLGLARWLVGRDNPLVARVAVNRFWQQMFGVGIVRTSEDFGHQGEPPSHPLLLDWLAVRFVEGGWDVKALLRQMVLSSTYRQAVTVRSDHLRLDPDNRLLARAHRFRLDGETLRDQALMLGGLLVLEVGGPPVKPPQPDGLWRAVGYTSSNTAKFRADTAPGDVHRRSLYTFWKRTAPPPQMTTFDAPSREECRVRRERTNTPMQALLLMNDPQYVEASRAFAERILRRSGSDRERIAWAIGTATCVEACPDDTAAAFDLLREGRRVFAADPEAAGRLTAIGATPPDGSLDRVDLAAWTMVANLILNLDAVLTRS